tara:strand:- start:2423 stop:3193 length:771 start_codon:yes stop_codon:yes gene_type:complete
MNIIVDTRETNLLSLLTCNQATCNQATSNITSENLTIGDIHLCTPDNNPILIFERKTVNDLAASIQDGRYKEQSIRLHNSTIPNHHIVFLIEGDIDKYKGNSFSKQSITAKALKSSIVSILYTKGFSVLFSKNTQDSANWILQFADKMHRSDYKAHYNPCLSNDSTPQVYTEHIKMKKQSNITPENIDQIMLSQIPGISNAIAKAILTTYSTVSKLTQTLMENPDSLKGFSYTTAQGKERKLPKNVISNLNIYLKI